MEGNLRVRGAIERWFAVLVVVAAILAVAGGFLTATAYTAADTTTEQRQVPTYATQATFDHQAEVRAPNPVFPTGAVLENRSVYFRAVAPVASGTHALTYETENSGSATLSSVAELQIRSVDAESGQVYWERTRTLDQATTDAAGPGDRVRTAVQLNVSQIRNRTEQIRDELGASVGQTEVTLVFRDRIAGQIAGQQVEREQVYTVPVSIDGGTYRFEGNGTWSSQYEETVVESVPVSQSPLRRFGGPALAGLGLLGLVGLGALRATGRHELAEAERAELTYRRHRTEYEDWITRASLPERAIPQQRATVPNLEDLVDLAIDTEERVIEDPDRGRYLVVRQKTAYVYTPPVPIDDA